LIQDFDLLFSDNLTEESAHNGVQDDSHCLLFTYENGRIQYQQCGIGEIYDVIFNAIGKSSPALYD
jgi:hypothetical protein